MIESISFNSAISANANFQANREKPEEELSYIQKLIEQSTENLYEGRTVSDARAVEKTEKPEDSFGNDDPEKEKQLAALAEANRVNKATAYTQTGNITNIANVSGAYMSMLS